MPSVRARKNLTIMTGATVTGLLFDGRRVTGVSAMVDGASRDFHGGEIVLCAGAIHSPAFLLRAGIGPAAELRALGIDVIADLPGVGRNLQNHPIAFHRARICAAARASRSRCARIRSPACAIRPGCPAALPSDMYIAAHSKSSWSALGAQIANFNATIFKPASRGRVTLVSAEPARPPRIEFNFVGEEIDLLRLMDGFRRIVALVSSDAGARAVHHRVPGAVHRPKSGSSISSLARTRSRRRSSPARSTPFPRWPISSSGN